MAEQIVKQLGFGFQPKLRIDFEGGTITSDAGLTLIREFDHALGLTADVASRVSDDRDQRYITHDMLTLVRQRAYQIVAGYEDANDADRLKDDPTFQTIASPSLSLLGSQPTLSRLENDIDWSSIARLSRVGLDWFCEHAFAAGSAPRELILDLDSTDDPTHGQQQFALFHGAYNQHMYHPLCWFEGKTGLLLKTRLRPGLDHSASFVVEDLKQIVPPLRQRFPKSKLRLRADAGMATPTVETALEEHCIEYVMGIGTNPVFKQRTAKLKAKAEARYQRRQHPVQVRTSFWHRARRWEHRRRILVKIDVTAVGTNVRFMITNRQGSAKDLVKWYDQRGEAENRIKELKLGMYADRLSCHRFRANAVRLQLHTIATLLMTYFRRSILADTVLAQASPDSIRIRLLKVGARVVRTARQIHFHIAAHWPGQDLFQHCQQILAAENSA
jgi:Transposase DDE domain group 1